MDPSFLADNGVDECVESCSQVINRGAGVGFHLEYTTREL
jgi:hypothetical protein